MGGCFWHGRRKSKTDLVINDFGPKKEINDEVKGEIWFDSRLVFESDSDDDFKSVNGDSLPSSFGYSYSNQGTPRPTFASLKERMESMAQQNGFDGTHSAPQSDPTSPDGKKTLGELFTHKPEADKKPESENKHHVSRHPSAGHLHDKVSQKSCLPGLLSSVGINSKKPPTSPEPNKTKTTQVRLPFRLCAS